MSGVLGSVTDQLNITKYSDWLTFVQRLEELVSSGRARRIPTTRQIFLKDEEWYLDTETGEIYVYVSPDAPILPIWEKVDVFAPMEVSEPHPSNLSAIPTGRKSRSEAKGLKGILDFLICQGAVEPIDPSNMPTLGDSTEKWFKDLQTEVVYRLIQRGEEEENLWERVPQSELEARVQ